MNSSGSAITMPMSMREVEIFFFLPWDDKDWKRVFHHPTVLTRLNELTLMVTPPLRSYKTRPLRSWEHRGRLLVSAILAEEKIATKFQPIDRISFRFRPEELSAIFQRWCSAPVDIAD